MPSQNRMQNSDGKYFKHGLCAEGIEAFLLNIECLFTLYLNEATRSLCSSTSRDTINFSVDDTLSEM